MECCPVCGSDCIDTCATEDMLWYVECVNCGCHTDLFYRPDTATYAWNMGEVKEGGVDWLD